MHPACKTKGSTSENILGKGTAHSNVVDSSHVPVLQPCLNGYSTTDLLDTNAIYKIQSMLELKIETAFPSHPPHNGVSCKTRCVRRHSHKP